MLHSFFFHLALVFMVTAPNYPIPMQETHAVSHELLIEWVDLKLLNQSAFPIKLHIPGVMNPNLSPFSESGVSIKTGTVVYFYHKKKKYELITVTESMDKVLVINELVTQRKSELGL